MAFELYLFIKKLLESILLLKGELKKPQPIEIKVIINKPINDIIYHNI